MNGAPEREGRLGGALHERREAHPEVKVVQHEGSHSSEEIKERDVDEELVVLEQELQPAQ